MPIDQELCFYGYRLDAKNMQLWRQHDEVQLTGKAFAVLHFLASHAGQLVSKGELFQAVWPTTVVSESTLTSCIKELRKALQDDAKAPQYIETVHRRGYRFIAPLTSTSQPHPSLESRVQGLGSENQNLPSLDVRTLDARRQTLDASLVGREAELVQLHHWLERALQGERQMVFVTGEPGIGKTTVIDTFVARWAAGPEVLVGRGQCIEHYGTGEAYMPVLEALGRLCRGSASSQVVNILKRYAPTWLVQMPWLLSDDEHQTLRRKTLGMSREGLLRELAEALEALTTETPVVFVLEDLHWSDYSTLDVLSFVARRREPARLLLIGTYRPGDAAVTEHPVRAVTQELTAHRHCEHLQVGVLSETDVRTYLALQLADGAPSVALLQELAGVIHQRTEGNPLFMVNVVDDLLERGVLRQQQGKWELTASLDAVQDGVPESLRQLIEKQSQRLDPAEQRMLEVASVMGMEFSAAAVAAMLAQDVADVEERCETLADRHLFLQAWREPRISERRLAARYAFRHALYQTAFYERLTPSRRQQSHQQVGEWQETAYGVRAKDIAAELALHFEQGRDYQRAMQYLERAAQNAMWTYAYREAIGHLNQGLALLSQLPASAERTQQELALQVGLSLSLMHTHGFVAPVVEQAYTRTRVLCQAVGDSLPRFAALWGLRNFHSLRGEPEAAQAAAQELLDRVQQTRMSVLLPEAHLGLGATLFSLGECNAARMHVEQSLALSDPHASDHHVFLTGQDPRASGRAHLALLLWILGYPDQAREHSRQALALAQNALFPYSQALALNLAAILQLCYRDAQGVEHHAEASQSFARKCGFGHLLVMGMVLQGWALVMQGKSKEGIALMEAGFEKQHALGVGIGWVHYRMLLAEAYAEMGHTEAGLEALAEAFTTAEKTRERTYEAELYRLKGELTLAQSRVPRLASRIQNPQSAFRNPQSEAEACFLKAIEIAHRQSAKSLELRAVISLSRLWQRQGKAEEAQQILSEVYGWFTEGFDTADLQDAKSLLAELA